MKINETELMIYNQNDNKNASTLFKIKQSVGPLFILSFSFK